MTGNQKVKFMEALFADELEEEYLGNQFVPCDELYTHYKIWCAQCNFKPVNIIVFGRSLGKLGYEAISKRVKIDSPGGKQTTKVKRGYMFIQPKLDNMPNNE